MRTSVIERKCSAAISENHAHVSREAPLVDPAVAKKPSRDLLCLLLQAGEGAIFGALPPAGLRLTPSRKAVAQPAEAYLPVCEGKLPSPYPDSARSRQGAPESLFFHRQEQRNSQDARKTM